MNFRSSYSDKNGVHSVTSDKSEVDLYCIYCPDTNNCYYINPVQFSKSVNLRIQPSKNQQSEGIHLASNFRKIQ
ncbi:group I intron-associated PD-(D/E)XK endonuclease [Armatimonas sp.]|uniref:group I intron-associated PD-(D/E)XK endonuclease n=1 Tax=Armatimonas sp. TaxID=1872638 RepID=UPI0034D95298